MKTREPLEAAMVGTATFFSKTIMIILKFIGVMLIVFTGILFGLVSGVLTKK